MSIYTYIKMDGYNIKYFLKGDIIQSAIRGNKMIIVKVYKNNRWRRFFRMRVNQFKVKPFA